MTEERVRVNDPLEFLVTVKGDNVPRAVQFEQLHGLKSEITSMTLLWNTNCYHVNVSQKAFIINGGRKMVIKGFEKAEAVELLYVRRNRFDVDLQKIEGNGQLLEPKQSYILGFQGIVDGEKREIMLHINETGKSWYWRNHR